MARIPTVAGSQQAAPVGGGGVSPVMMQAAGMRRGGGQMRNVRRNQPAAMRNKQLPTEQRQAVLQDANALNARYRGAEAVGQAMQQTAGFMTAYALQKQELINKGVLASEDTIRMQTGAEIEKYMQQNADKPETWAGFANETWKGYEEARKVRQEEQKWAPVVANVDSYQYKNYRVQTALQFQAAENKAMIRQANGRIEANAAMKLRGGDYVGFVQQMDQLNASPEQKEEAIRRGLEEGTYKIASNELDSIGQMPPAQAVEAYKSYVGALTERDEKGNFKSYEMVRGGMSLGARVTLESTANARIRETQRAMDSNGRRLVNEMRLGRATQADVAAAVAAGTIDGATAEVLAPDLALAAREQADRQLSEAQRKQAEADRAAEAAASKARTMDNNADATRRDAIERGRIGARDIDRRLVLGEINADQAAKLKAELQQAALAEQGLSGGDYSRISEKIKGRLGAKVFGGQPSDADYQKLQGEILNAAVTKESRMKLMGQLLDLKLADMQDLEEEGPEDGRWMDRTITAPERDMRRNLIASYRTLMPALGDAVAGDLLMNQEAKIRAFFDTAGEKGRTAAEIDAFTRDKLMPDIQQAAGYEGIKDAFDF